MVIVPLMEIVKQMDFEKDLLMHLDFVMVIQKRLVTDLDWRMDFEIVMRWVLK